MHFRAVSSLLLSLSTIVNDESSIKIVIEMASFIKTIILQNNSFIFVFLSSFSQRNDRLKKNEKSLHANGLTTFQCTVIIEIKNNKYLYILNFHIWSPYFFLLIIRFIRPTFVANYNNRVSQITLLKLFNLLVRVFNYLLIFKESCGKM